MHKRHFISHPHERALECLLWGIWRKLAVLEWHHTVYFLWCHVYFLFVDISRPNDATYIFCLSIFPDRMMPHRFLQRTDNRQHTDLVGIEAIRSVVECSTICNQLHGCMGFNFKRRPAVVYEMFHVPHDAPGANVSIDHGWNHYAIVP